MPTRVQRSDEEWLSLITESRQSGLSDADWCRLREIPLSSFYNAVVRLRKKAVAIPSSVTPTVQTLDLTARQEVVQINIEPELSPTAVAPATTAECLGKLHTIKISSMGMDIFLSNEVDPSLMRTLIETVRNV